MYPEYAAPWGPPPLPELLTQQLAAHGLLDAGALECANRIADADPVEKASLFVDLGSLKFLEADIDGAVAAWRHAIASSNDEAAAAALVNLGLLYEHLRLHDRALAVLGSVAGRDVEPHVSRSAMVKARCQVALGDAEGATETMARLAQSTMATGGADETLADVLFGLGCVADVAGRDDRAERAWRAAAVGATDSTRQAALAQLVDLFLEHERDGDLLDLVERHPTDVGALDTAAVMGRADHLRRVGYDDQALKLAEAVAGAGLAATDRFRLAEIRLHCGLVNEAIDELELLLGHDDVSTECRAAFALGEIYCAYEMGDAAVAMFDRVIDANDPNWSPKAALAMADELYAQGEAEAAESFWLYAADSDLHSVQRAAEHRLTDLAQVGPADVSPTLGDESAAAIVDTVVAEEPAEVVEAPTAPEVSEIAEIDEVVAEPPVPAPVSAVDPDPVVVVLSSLDTPSGTRSVEPAVLAKPLVAPVDVPTSTPSSRPPVAQSPAELADPVVAEPVVIEPVVANAAPSEVVLAQQPEAEENPYAVLAPDSLDASPSSRNPYAELAPNYGADSFEASFGPEPGAWESMLEDWPDEDGVGSGQRKRARRPQGKKAQGKQRPSNKMNQDPAAEPAKPKPAPTAFSRYT